MPPLISIVLLVMAAPPDASTPDWNKAAVRTMLGRAQQAARAPTVEAQDTELAQLGGEAYGVKRNPSESNEVFAKRVVRSRDPDHPNVKSGQWLSALMRMFYADISRRSALLARFETNRNDRVYLEKMSEEAKAASSQIAGTLELTVEGLEGFVEPLPVAVGQAPELRGAMAMVHHQKITIENIDRITFNGNQPPDSAGRTAHGSLREVYGALKQYDVSAQMLGQYESQWRKNKGHLRVVIPQEYPAIYLNEIVRGGLEAGMKVLHLMTMSKRGELRELRLPMQWGAKATGKKEVVVSCSDEIPMQECATRIVHAGTLGSAVYGLR